MSKHSLLSKAAGFLSPVFLLNGCVTASKFDANKAAEQVAAYQKDHTCRAVTVDKKGITTSFDESCAKWEEDKAIVDACVAVAQTQGDKRLCGQYLLEKYFNDQSKRPAVDVYLKSVGILKKDETLESLAEALSNVRCTQASLGEFTCAPAARP